MTVAELASQELTEQVFTLRYAALRKRSETTPDFAGDLLQLAREAKRHGHRKLARQIMCSAAMGFAVSGRFVQANAAVDQCAEMAHVDDDFADESRAKLAKARVLQAAGEHDACFRTLIDLLKPALLQSMPRGLRFEVFNLLVGQCNPVDPGDSVELCLKLAERECEAQGEPPPPYFVVSRMGCCLDRYLWSDPRFQSMLRPLNLSPKSREEQIDRILSDGPAVMTDPRLAGSMLVRLVAEVLMDLAHALRSGAPDRIKVALEKVGRSGVQNPQFNLEIKYQIAAVAMLQGRLDLSKLALVDYSRNGVDLGGTTKERALLMLHLRSLVELEVGDADAALRLYQAYAQGMCAHMSNMNLRVRDLLSAVTVLPGARPKDNAHSMPQYLQEALTLLGRSADANVTVSTLASAVGVSDRTLRDAFSVHLGVSPKQYALRSRIDAAKDFLESGAAAGMTVRDMASQFGFAHASRFAVLFRERHGYELSSRLK
jgi:AraC-like DNA-binding protein